MGDRIDLDAIRQRHAQWHDDANLGMDEDEWDAYAVAVIGDRDALIAEVDRLTAELAESREAYDALCRMVGSSSRAPQ